MEMDDNQEYERKLSAITDALADQKARDLAVYRFSTPNSIADAFVIATATSGRHAQGLADSAFTASKITDGESPHMEGYNNAQWILVDCNDVIVHIFQEDARNLYRLDELCRHSALKEQQS